MSNILKADGNSTVYEGLRIGNQFVAKGGIGTVASDTDGVLSAAEATGSTDGAHATLGATTDAIYASGSGSLVSILKGIFSKLTTVVSNTAHNSAQAGYVPLTTPPAQTSVAADTAFTFSAQVNHWFIQNNTSANVQFELDSTASAGSPVIAPGSTWFSDVPVTVLHLYTAAAQNVNGSTGGNIALKGWA